MTPAEQTLAPDLDEKVKARLAEMEQLIGAIAHQLGATMLPSLKEDATMSAHRPWKRLLFQSEAMKEHIVGQKHALDFLRGAKRNDLDAMEASVWLDWVVPLLGGFVTHGQTPSLSFEFEGHVSLPFSRAVVLLLMSLDQQALADYRVAITHRDDVGIAVIEQEQESKVNDILIPPVALNAWRSAGSLSTLRSKDGVTLRVEFDRQDAD